MTKRRDALDESTMDPEQEEKSRSQLKREFQELKDLAQELVDLSVGLLRGVPLSDGIREAIVAAQKMDRAALKRQLRYIAGRMDDEDVDAIRSTLSGGPLVAKNHPAKPAVPEEAERWGDELISGDDQLLGQFVDEHPEFDRQHLRQLVRNARKERQLDQAPTSAQRLFDYLESLNSREG